MPRSKQKKLDRAVVADVARHVAASLLREGKLYSSPQAKWFARHSPSEPWLTGHAATLARDMLVTWKLFAIGTQTEGYGVVEARELSNRRGRDYFFIGEMQRFFHGVNPPEDLPS